MKECFGNPEKSLFESKLKREIESHKRLQLRIGIQGKGRGIFGLKQERLIAGFEHGFYYICLDKSVFMFYQVNLPSLLRVFQLDEVTLKGGLLLFLAQKLHKEHFRREILLFSMNKKAMCSLRCLKKFTILDAVVFKNQLMVLSRKKLI